VRAHGAHAHGAINGYTIIYRHTPRLFLPKLACRRLSVQHFGLDNKSQIKGRKCVGSVERCHSINLFLCVCARVSVCVCVRKRTCSDKRQFQWKMLVMYLIVTILLYCLLSVNDEHDVLAEFEDGHVTVNITAYLLRLCRQRPLETLSMRVRVQHAALPRHHNIRSYFNETFVVVYENVDKHQLIQHTRNRRAVNFDLGEATQTWIDNLRQNIDISRYCRVHSWKMNFTAVGWNWIEQPKAYEANYCAGICPPLFADEYLNTTNYSFAKNWHNVIYNGVLPDQTVAKACCTPTSYASRNILYHDASGSQFTKLLPQMIVTACGCR
jgi:hypothetical protein